MCTYIWTWLGYALFSAVLRVFNPPQHALSVRPVTHADVADFKLLGTAKNAKLYVRFLFCQHLLGRFSFEVGRALNAKFASRQGYHACCFTGTCSVFWAIKFRSRWIFAKVKLFQVFTPSILPQKIIDNFGLLRRWAKKCSSQGSYMKSRRFGFAQKCTRRLNVFNSCHFNCYSMFLRVLQ